MNDKNAKTNTTTPVPTGTDQQGEVYPELGTFSASWTGEDNYYFVHYSGTISGEDLDHSSQASSGDSVGSGSKEVVPSEAFTRIEDHGEPDAEIIRLDFSRRHLSD
jgi:hypothetical protein